MLLTPYLQHENEQLKVRQQNIVENAVEETVLNADLAAASGTCTVKSIKGFAIDQVLLIGELGAEDSEIIKTHGSTAPSGSTITFLSNTVYAHPAGTKVRVILFDSVEYSHATTATGSKSVLATETLDPDVLEKVYDETSKTTGFYFARFKETIGNTFSEYCDALPYGGWTQDSVGYMIEQAFLNLPGIDFSEKVTLAGCIRLIKDGINYIQGKQMRWPEHQKMNTKIDYTVHGENIITMPTDIYDNETNKSILAMRIGSDSNLIYRDPVEWEDRVVGGHIFTDVRTQASSGDTTLEIDNSYDFADSGSVSVYISGTKYTITYTGVTRSATAGVLTGVPASGTGSITVTIPVDTKVHHGEQVGQPTQFTVRNSQLEFWPIADDKYDNKAVYLDYFIVCTAPDSTGDTIDYQRFDMLTDYLTWRIKMLAKNEGNLNHTDGWFLSFKDKLNDAIKTKGRGFKYKRKPKLNRITY